MLLAAEVLEHYNAVRENNIEQIQNLDTGDDLAAADISPDTYQRFVGEFRGVDFFISRLNIHMFSSTPRPSLALIKMAFKDNEKLSDEPYQTEKLRFISQILFPMADITLGLPIAEVGLTGCGEIEGCKDAEQFFVDTYRQLQDSTYRRADDIRPQDSVTIFHTKNEQALGVQKTYSEPSTLMLETTKSGELWVPEATIVGVGITKTRQTGSYRRDGVTVKSYEIDDQLMIVPIRLSAWAYPEQIDRALFSVSNRHGEYDNERAAMIESCNMDDFRKVAQNALAECLSNGIAH